MSEELESAFDPKLFLATANQGRSVATYAADHIIFSQGDPADAVFYVQSGEINVVVTSEQGEEAVVGVIGAGELFGEGRLLARASRLAAATAVTDCKVTRIEKAEVVRLLHAEPAFTEFFMAHLLTRIGRVEADFVDQLNSKEERLALTLLLLAKAC